MLGQLAGAGRRPGHGLLLQQRRLLPGLVSLQNILREHQNLLAVLDDEVSLLDDTLGQVGSDGLLSSELGGHRCGGGGERGHGGGGGAVLR